MKNTDNSQPKQARRQESPKPPPGKKKQPLEKRRPRAMAMQGSDEKFRRLFETAQDGIFLLDAETGVISESNPAVEEMLGYSRTELIGKKLWETGPFKGVSASQNTFLKIQKKSHYRYDDLPLETKDGQLRNVEFVSNVYRVGSQKIIQCNLRDITERRQAENARMESNRRYQELFDNASLGIFQSTADGKVIAVNPEFAHMFGYQSPEEFISLVRNAADIFADPHRRAEIIRLKAENPDLTKFESLYRRKDGSIFHGNLTVRQVTVPDGHESFFDGFIENISDRKQTEEELANIKTTLETAFEQSPVPMVLVSMPDAVIRIANTACREFLGVMDEPVPVGQGLMDYKPSYQDYDSQGNLTLIDEAPLALALKGQRTVNQERRIVTKDGKTHWALVSGNPIFNAVGNIIAASMVLPDITERKQAEDALAKSEIKFRWLYEYAPIAYHILTPDGIITDVNHRWSELLGYNREAVIGKPIFDFAVTDEREQAKASFERKKRTRQSFIEGSERNFLTKDGAIKTFKTFDYFVLDQDQNITSVQTTIEDITIRKQAEETLAHQSEELHQRNDELARLYRASGSLISGGSLNLQEQARKIVEVVQQEFGQDNCSLLIIQKDSNVLVRLTAAGPHAYQVKYQTLTLDGPGLIPLAIRTNEVINVGDVHSSPDYVLGWDLAQSELVVPLKIGNNVIGVMDVQSSELNAFSPGDERRMTIFAERAALVLEHSRLNTQTEARIQQLMALRTIDIAISSSFDINLTLGVLLDQVIGQLGLHAADILIFNSATQTFKFSCERGFRAQTLRHTRLKNGAGYAWRAVRERQVINIPDLTAGPDGLQRSPDLSAEQFVTYIGIPLTAKGQIKGILEIFNREPVRFEPEKYSFLEILAGQAAIAIDNAELFDNLQSSNSELSQAYERTLEGWATALELRDHDTQGHTRRTAELTMQLGQAMGINEYDLVHLYRGALLHDIGKMGVPDSIVLKAGPLTDEEQVSIRKHPQYAYDMLSPISYLRLALDIPYCHHEKWDGTGYPRRLVGEQIPLAARIFAVVDVWDALTSDRPYRKEWTAEKAIDFIREQAGKHFDPKVVEIFLREVKHA